MDLQYFDKKAVALDIRSSNTPFPALFLIHEMRVRGFHPFKPTQPPITSNPTFQDWIDSSGVFDYEAGAFLRDRPSGGGGGGRRRNDKFSITFVTDTPDLSSKEVPLAEGEMLLDLNQNTVMEILAATRAMPSWKACIAEGLSWDGTAEENIEKYTVNVGVDDDNDGGS